MKSFLRILAGVTACLWLSGCVGAPGTSTPPAQPATAPQSASPEPTFSILPAESDEIARTVLTDGVETPAPSAPLQLDGSSYDVVGECRGAGDLDELPYRVLVDSEEVSSGAIACRTNIATRNSAFSGYEGVHEVEVRFADGVDPQVVGYAVIKPSL